MSSDSQVKEENLQWNADEESPRKHSRKYLALLRKMMSDLGSVYRFELSDSNLLNIWADALSDLSPAIIRAGCGVAIKAHLDFMPTPAQFRRYCEDAASKLHAGGYELPIDGIRRRNVIDEVKEIAEEMHPGYNALDKQGNLVTELCRRANIVRYLRQGKDPKWLPDQEEVQQLREKYVRATS